MEAETQVWVRNEAEAWVKATVVEKVEAAEGGKDEEGKATLRLRVDATGEVMEVLTADDGESPDVKLQNINEFGQSES